MAVFNLSGLPTTASCEGHNEIGEHRPWPWVEIGAPDEPEERFVGQKELFEKTAQQQNVSLEKLKRGEPEDLYWALQREIIKNPETPEYLLWQERNRKLQEEAEKLLQEFYEKRKVDEDVRLSTGGSSGSNFDISSEHDREIMLKLLDQSFTEAEKQSLLQKLPARKKEMRDFTEFLKGKFLD